MIMKNPLYDLMWSEIVGSQSVPKFIKLKSEHWPLYAVWHSLEIDRYVRVVKRAIVHSLSTLWSDTWISFLPIRVNVQCSFVNGHFCCLLKPQNKFNVHDIILWHSKYLVLSNVILAIFKIFSRDRPYSKLNHFAIMLHSAERLDYVGITNSFSGPMAGWVRTNKICVHMIIGLNYSITPQKSWADKVILNNLCSNVIIWQLLWFWLCLCSHDDLLLLEIWSHFNVTSAFHVQDSSRFVSYIINRDMNFNGQIFWYSYVVADYFLLQNLFIVQHVEGY